MIAQGQNLRMKRSIAKEQQRAFKMWQKRGGNARQGPRGQGGRYQGDRPKVSANFCTSKNTVAILC